MHRANLHAIYAETGGKKVERDQLQPEHFAGWISWARRLGIGLDFNETYFSHPMAESGFTLSSRDKKVRDFWVRHTQRCREIGREMGRAVGTPCIVNLWIADGYKDVPADRLTPRQLLKESLDRIFETRMDPRFVKDAVEGKLFGIGSESYVVGSHEFYLAYAVKNDMMLTLDMGHFHPTESVADKISPLLLFSRELLLHVSRGVRWDSDHVVTLNDEVKAVAAEVARARAWDRVHVATDYFDASINRVAAWVIGARATLTAMLMALLEPIELLKKEEAAGNLTARLALMEEIRNLPYRGGVEPLLRAEGRSRGRGLDGPGDRVRAIGPLQEALGMDLSELIEVSRHYGRGNDFVISGGGNTSVKDRDRMAIKASGTALRDITADGFVELSRPRVREILARTYSTDALRREAEIKATSWPAAPSRRRGGGPPWRRPSTRCWNGDSSCIPIPLRSTLSPAPATASRLPASCSVTEPSGCPTRTPAIGWRSSWRRSLRRTASAHRGEPRIVLMQNHGLVVAADTAAEIHSLTDEVVRKISARFRAPLPREERPVSDAAVRLLPALRMLLSDAGAAKIAAARNSALAEHFLAPANRQGVELPFMPDNIVYCKSAPLFLDGRSGGAPRRLSRTPWRLPRPLGIPAEDHPGAGNRRRRRGGHQAAPPTRASRYSRT